MSQLTNSVTCEGLAVGAGELNERLSDELAEASEEIERKNKYIASLEAENGELRRRMSNIQDPTSGY